MINDENNNQLLSGCFVRINSSADRLALQREVSALKLEISRIASTTQFGGVNVLDGAYSAAFLVGANAGQTISVNISRTGGFGTSGLFGAQSNANNNVSVTTVEGASRALTSILGAISIIDGKDGRMGSACTTR